MLRCVFAALLSLCAISSFSQRDKKEGGILERGASWSEGSVMLNDGTELKGVLRHDTKTGILSFQNGDINKSFTAKSVVGFEIFDESVNKQRVFYSFPYIHPATDLISPQFFEALKEFKHFAVLSKVDPIDVDQRRDRTPNFNPYSPVTSGGTEIVTEITQTETIYFMNPKGDIKPYLKIIDKDVDRFMFDSSTTKNKLVDEELLEQYAGSHYAALKSYAKENKLSFKRKKDLLEILEHYGQLLSKN